MKKSFLLIAILCLLSIVAKAQNNTNSPYTRFGYGQLHDGSFGRSQSMGGISYGLRSKGNINPVNPAAYSCIDSTSFLFEMGVSGLISDFRSGDTRKNTFTGNLEYVALQFPIAKFMGMSLGLTPYSFVGYSFNTKDSILLVQPGNDSTYVNTNRSFGGNGGITQLYLGLSFNIAKRVSLGANFYYLFGNINNNRYLYVTSSEGNTTYNTLSQNNIHVRSFNTRFGIQYHQPIGSNDMLTIGAIYEYQSKLSNTIKIETIAADTIVQDIKSNNFFELPQTFGGGFTYNHNDRLTVGADVTYQQFATAKYYDAVDSLHNRMKFCAGAEYVHNPKGKKYIDRMMWRIGANYTSSYISVNGQNTNDFSVTCGVGFPLRTIRSIINFNFEYGHIGQQASNLLTEQYFKFGLNVSINERWFQKISIK